MKIQVVDPSNFSLPYDHSFCEALARSGCQVTLVRSRFEYWPWSPPASYCQDESFYRFSHGGDRATKRGGLWSALKFIDHLVSMQQFLANVRRDPPDVIHFQWLPVPAVDSRFVRRLRKLAPLVYTLHNTTAFHGSARSRLQALGFWKSLLDFDLIVVHTEYSRKQLLQNTSFPPDQVHVVPHGVLDYLRGAVPSVPRDSAAADFRTTLLFFGGIRSYKGLDVLLDACALLTEQARGKCRMVIAGAPQMPLASLQERGDALKGSLHLEWKLGYIPEKQVAALLEEADAVVLPYRESDQSGVLMLALGFGKPVIASRVGGFEEVIRNGVHGILFPPGDARALARAIETVVSEPDCLRRMREEVEQLSKTFLSWDRIANEMVPSPRSDGNRLALGGNTGFRKATGAAR